MSSIIAPFNRDPRIIEHQNLLEILPLFRHLYSSILAHSNAMPISLPLYNQGLIKAIDLEILR